MTAMRPLARGMGFCLPLAAGERFRLAPRREVVISLGSVPLDGRDHRGVLVILELSRTEGKGVFAVGVRWPGEDTVWSDTEFRVEDEPYAIPIEPERGDGAAQVDVFVRVRARLAPVRGRLTAFVQIPWGGAA